MTEVIHHPIQDEAARETFGSLTRQATEAAKALDRSCGQLGDGLGADLALATDALREFREEIVRVQAGALKHQEGLREDFSELKLVCGETADAASAFRERMDAEAQTLISEVAQTGEEAAASRCRAGEAIESVGNALRVGLGTLQEGEEDAKQAFTLFSDSLQASRCRIEDGGKQTGVGLDRLVEAIQEMGLSSETALVQLSKKVSKELPGDAEEGMDLLKSFVRQMSVDVDDVVAGLARNLEEAITPILWDLAEHGGRSGSNLQSALEHGMDAGRDLHAAFATVATTIRSAAATAAELTPMLPELAAARVAAETMEKAMDLLEGNEGTPGTGVASRSQGGATDPTGEQL